MNFTREDSPTPLFRLDNASIRNGKARMLERRLRKARAKISPPVPVSPLFVKVTNVAEHPDGCSPLVPNRSLPLEPSQQQQPLLMVQDDLQTSFEPPQPLKRRWRKDAALDRLRDSNSNSTNNEDDSVAIRVTVHKKCANQTTAEELLATGWMHPQSKSDPKMANMAQTTSTEQTIQIGVTGSTSLKKKKPTTKNQASQTKGEVAATVETLAASAVLMAGSGTISYLATKIVGPLPTLFTLLLIFGKRNPP
jgi:hypothetical protein